MNTITMVGFLGDIDKNSTNIRYISTEREYKNQFGEFQRDIIPCLFWTREEKNELFSLKSGSMVLVKGRIENYQDKMIVLIIESIIYLGLKG